jgi:DNA-binding transcriptional regulator YhcF (GntR family)
MFASITLALYVCASRTRIGLSGHGCITSPVMTVDPGADRAVYKQLADLIRNQIKSGELPPGRRLPAQKDYMQEHGISRASVDRAMHVLRSEGLIVTDRRGSRVRSHSDQITVLVERGRITARMPSDPERRDFGVAEGVPLLVVAGADGSEQVHPADRTVIVVNMS